MNTEYRKEEAEGFNETLGCLIIFAWLIIFIALCTGIWFWGYKVGTIKTAEHIEQVNE